ncbi:hypothetical protein D3C76_1533300 [compost metagenome]
MLGLNTELKQRTRTVIDPMRHAPAPRRPNVVEGWLERFDDALRALGIAVQRPSGHSESPKPAAAASLKAQLAEQLQHVKYREFDNRMKGGAYRVQLAEDDAKARAALLRLGFKPVKGEPLAFWRI